VGRLRRGTWRWARASPRGTWAGCAGGRGRGCAADWWTACGGGPAAPGDVSRLRRNDVNACGGIAPGARARTRAKPVLPRRAHGFRPKACAPFRAEGACTFTSTATAPLAPTARCSRPFRFGEASVPSRCSKQSQAVQAAGRALPRERADGHLAAAEPAEPGAGFPWPTDPCGQQPKPNQRLPGLRNKASFSRQIRSGMVRGPGSSWPSPTQSTKYEAAREVRPLPSPNGWIQFRRHIT
jgi:hypothetical protein